MLFRRASLYDIDAIVQLRLAQLKEENDGLVVNLSDAVNRFYTNSIEKDTACIWLACEGNNVIATGCLCYYRITPYLENPTGRIGQITSMYTSQKYRRRGIATQIMKNLLEDAAQRQTYIIRVNASEVGAVFYQSLGFRPKERSMEFKIDSLRL
jgi:GNAT superfamily N-acetyltransferase